MGAPVVLVVDPAAQTAERVGQALAGTRYVVRAVRDSVEAEPILDSERIVAVLAAITLPHGNAYDLARRVRARHPEAAVLAVSGGFDVFNSERAAEAGISRRISRPFSAEVVRHHLEIALGPLETDEEPTLDPAELESLPDVEPERAAEAAPPVRQVVPGLFDGPAAPPSEPAPPVGDERLSSFLPRDWRNLPPVRVDPEVVAPAVERAILAVLPVVVESVLNKALATSPAFREMLEVAVEEALREELPAIARGVIRERMAEIERASRAERRMSDRGLAERSPPPVDITGE